MGVILIVKYNADYLKPLKRIDEPDSRQLCFQTFDNETKDFRPTQIEDYYNRIAEYQLKSSVPEEVITQFETCKNIYLYAWYVYRFYPVSELYAFTCLEYALRYKYGDELAEQGENLKYIGLKYLLKYSIYQGHINNEGFQVWRDAVKRKARYRYEDEKTNEMREKGLNEIMLDYSEVEIKDIDKNWDYIEVLTDTLPNLRNHYAHGSTTLHNQVLGTIQIVSEIINQIYD